MQKLLFLAAMMFSMGVSASMAIAAGGYNDVPSSDYQYQQCITYANNNYTGGNEASPVPGQTKAAAFCECMWNETPDDFRGDLGKFADTTKGQETNRTCEKHSNWGN